MQAVAADMHAAYAQAVAAQTPDAELVDDKFHVANHLKEAVDQVRRAKHKALQAVNETDGRGGRGICGCQ